MQALVTRSRSQYNLIRKLCHYRPQYSYPAETGITLGPRDAVNFRHFLGAGTEFRTSLSTDGVTIDCVIVVIHLSLYSAAQRFHSAVSEPGSCFEHLYALP